MNCYVNNCTHIEMLFTQKWKNYIEVKSEIEWKIQEKKRDGFKKKILCLINLPFKSCSTEFYEFLRTKNEMISRELYYPCESCHSNSCDACDYIKPFLLVESYFRDKIPNSVDKIESYLKVSREKDFDAYGIEILRPVLANGIIVRNVYCSKDKDLIQLFKKYLPKPSMDLFERDGYPIPDFIKEEVKQADATISALAQRHGIETLERHTIAMQRRVRGHQRKVKELLRVMKINMNQGFWCDSIITNKCILEDKIPHREFRSRIRHIEEKSHNMFYNEVKKRIGEAKRYIFEGNKPYIPKCKDRILAERIFNAAYLVPNFPIIRHITSAQALPKILDDCLYGRQTLATRYIPFRPAQLHHCDQENGDANAICFGPEEIDKNVWKLESVEIILDMEKFRDRRIERRNPCIFFKQQDLCYELEKTRTVMISKDASITFNHTAHLQCQQERHTGFILNPDSDDTRRYAQVPFQQLISSNFESMTAIQTLNFFRYLDSLSDSSYKEVDVIYDKIAQLDDKQLVDFLRELHNKSTDTAEFNFYGAYRIDPELIEGIRYVPNGDSSDGSVSFRLSQLIDSLNQVDLTLYREVREKMPFLFESKRFVNFLRSKVKDPVVLEG